MAKYQKYAEYQDSGIEWLGQIPNHWAMSKLRYLFDFSKGLSITKENLQDEGIPCVNYGEVHSKYGFEVNPKKHPLKYVSENYLKTSENALLNIGDFIFADTSEDLKGSGNFTHLVGDERIFAGYHTVIARPHNANSSRFYAYLFDSKEFRSQIQLAVKGVKVFSITQAMLRSADAWLPSPDEQTQIANFLDHETAQIDTLIAKQEKLIELLKEKRQAVISHAVTKGLNPDVTMKYSGVEWLGQVPEHWKVAPIKRIIHLMEQGKSPECENIPATSEQWGVLKTSCVNNGVFHSQQNKALPEHTKPHTQYQVKAGDVLMSRASGSINLIGSVALVPNDVQENLLLSDKIFRIHLTKDCDAKFFTLLMATPYMRTLIERAISGAEGMANNITKTSILEFVSAIPPLTEQLELVDYISQKVQTFDLLVLNATKAIELMQERRTALISSAVTGKIDVRHWQNPNKNNDAKTELGA
ncbi:restriction endonuclease subunit S [Acinetobacter sp. Marseille-Q1618]|uniref:restriction endonuclease subunit S n=1 Tax=Acinetobacter sp. Marseille-Q1618 TaxID=2697502 RepID=UPI00156F5226|nr:restriction endonuclease subunit S [Acinetobacter sp. Marseille-Q1618]